MTNMCKECRQIKQGDYIKLTYNNYYHFLIKVGKKMRKPRDIYNNQKKHNSFAPQDGFMIQETNPFALPKGHTDTKVHNAWGNGKHGLYMFDKINKMNKKEKLEFHAYKMGILT